jgi:acyl carrier protein
MSSPNPKSGAQQPTEDFVIGALVEIGFDRSEISMEMSLEDLDVSSLDVVEFIEIVREELHVELQGKDVQTCVKIQDLADLIDRGSPARESSTQEYQNAG